MTDLCTNRLFSTLRCEVHLCSPQLPLAPLKQNCLFPQFLLNICRPLFIWFFFSYYNQSKHCCKPSWIKSGICSNAYFGPYISPNFLSNIFWYHWGTSEIVVYMYVWRRLCQTGLITIAIFIDFIKSNNWLVAIPIIIASVSSWTSMAEALLPFFHNYPTCNYNYILGKLSWPL